MRLKTLIIVGAIVVAFSVFIITQIARQSQRSTPNGYPLLLQAAGQIVGRNPLRYTSTPTREQLQPFIQNNQTALQTIRRALQMPCKIEIELSHEWRPLRTPAHVSRVSNELGDRMAEKSKVRELGWLLYGEGKVYELNSNLYAASQSYVDAVRLGESVKGGLPIDRITLQAVSMMGRKGLLDVLPQLSGATSSLAANQLLTLLKNAEPLETVWARDRQWEKRAYGVVASEYLRKRLGTNVLYQELLWSMKMRQAALQLTILELAVHAFRRGEKRLPANLQELVPRYLPELPSDLLGDKPFVYNVMNNGSPLIYSVGRNGKDDGGRGDDVIARVWLRRYDVEFRKAYFGG